VFEQTFKNIDNIPHKHAGCTSELACTEQSSWLLFLKVRALNDALADLVLPDQLRRVFDGFQRHLHQHGDG
jgi:hypothetical protein